MDIKDIVVSVISVGMIISGLYEIATYPIKVKEKKEYIATCIKAGYKEEQCKFFYLNHKQLF